MNSQKLERGEHDKSARLNRQSDAPLNPNQLPNMNEWFFANGTWRRDNIAPHSSSLAQTANAFPVFFILHPKFAHVTTIPILVHVHERVLPVHVIPFRKFRCKTFSNFNWKTPCSHIMDNHDKVITLNYICIANDWKMLECQIKITNKIKGFV